MTTVKKWGPTDPDWGHPLDRSFPAPSSPFPRPFWTRIHWEMTPATGLCRKWHQPPTKTDKKRFKNSTGQAGAEPRFPYSGISFGIHARYVLNSGKRTSLGKIFHENPIFSIPGERKTGTKQGPLRALSSTKPRTRLEGSSLSEISPLPTPISSWRTGRETGILHQILSSIISHSRLRVVVKFRCHAFLGNHFPPTIVGICGQIVMLGFLVQY